MRKRGTRTQLNLPEDCVVKPYPHDERYLVTTDGRVFSTLNDKFLKPGTCNKYGHVSVSIGRSNSKMVHAIVLETHVCLRPSPKHDASHINGIGDDNRVENLQWATRTENNLDITRHDRRKFSNEVVRQIKVFLAHGVRVKDLVEYYGMSESHVYNIKHGRQRNAR